jgi:predicted dehydrogenase
MAVKIGLIGMGFMGNMHFETYQKIKGAKIVAICDQDKKKLAADAGATGNIALGGGKRDLSEIETFTKLEKMLERDDIDLIDICLPTYLHCDAALKAFAAGKNVLSEKPLALNAKDAKKMVDAAKKAKKQLFIGHCIRYWPAYAKAREIVKSGEYGKVVSARFVRLSPSPVWAWDNWLLDGKRSGAAAMDLHIHDTDFILYAFGKPKAVTSDSVGMGGKKQCDHIVTTYDYGKNKLITAEGGWDMPGSYPFQMTFSIVMEKGTLNFPTDMKLSLHTLGGKTKKIRVSPKDGYNIELTDIISCLNKGKKCSVVTPESSLASVKLVEAEIKSALTGKTIPVKL